ncbi:MAG: DUF6788 family protein [Verrucomicrobiota bacterium]|jgi:hypothetical protein
MQDKNLATWEKQLADAKTALQQLGPMRPGNLSQQFKRPGQKNGPYWQLSYTFRQHSYGRYIRPDEVDELNALIANFKRFKALVDQCIELSIQIADRKIQLRRQAQDEPVP